MTTTQERTAPQQVDLIVQNAYLITMDSERRVFTNGALAVDSSRIVGVDTTAEISQKYQAQRTIDAAGSVVHPGYVDNHIHLMYHLIRWGIPDGVGWDDALPLHGGMMGVMNDDVIRIATTLSSLEMARNGTTCFLEAGGVANTTVAAEAIEQVGIRGLLGGCFVRDISPGGPTTAAPDRDAAFENLGAELWRNKDADALVRGVVSMSGMGSCSVELQLAGKKLADESGVILNQHQSYQQLDVSNDDERFGRHPLVEYADIGLLGENTMFAHVNIIRDDEIAPIVESGLSISWCPMASMLFGVGGTFHGKHLELYKQGVNIALGCDSANWTSAFDLNEQGFIALLTAREKTGDPGALVAEDIFEMATINGAKASGRATELGSLEVGKRADLVIRSQDMPEALPMLDPLRYVVYSSRSKSVDTVIVNGNVIVENGHSTQVDEEEFAAHTQEFTNELFKRMDQKPAVGRWPRI